MGFTETPEDLVVEFIVFFKREIFLGSAESPEDLGRMSIATSGESMLLMSYRCVDDAPGVEESQLLHVILVRRVEVVLGQAVRHVQADLDTVFTEETSINKGKILATDG